MACDWLIVISCVAGHLNWECLAPPLTRCSVDAPPASFGGCVHDCVLFGQGQKFRVLLHCDVCDGDASMCRQNIPAYMPNEWRSVLIYYTSKFAFIKLPCQNTAVCYFMCYNSQFFLMLASLTRHTQEIYILAGHNQEYIYITFFK